MREENQIQTMIQYSREYKTESIQTESIQTERAFL